MVFNLYSSVKSVIILTGLYHPPTHPVPYLFLQKMSICWFAVLILYAMLFFILVYFEYKLTTFKSKQIYFHIMRHSLPFFFFVFSTIYSKQMFHIKIADGWIWTRVLWCQKWPLCLNHCPVKNKFQTLTNWAVVVV